MFWFIRVALLHVLSCIPQYALANTTTSEEEDICFRIHNRTAHRFDIVHLQSNHVRTVHEDETLTLCMPASMIDSYVFYQHGKTSRSFSLVLMNGSPTIMHCQPSASTMGSKNYHCELEHKNMEASLWINPNLF